MSQQGLNTSRDCQPGSAAGSYTNASVVSSSFTFCLAEEQDLLRPLSTDLYRPPVTPEYPEAHLLTEGFPEPSHGGRGEGSPRNAAHHHRLASMTGAVGLEGRQLSQFTAGQVGFIAGAVDRVVPVGGLLPASEHPGQTEEAEPTG